MCEHLIVGQLPCIEEQSVIEEVAEYEFDKEEETTSGENFHVTTAFSILVAKEL